jgi:acyl carrier protein
MPNLSSEEVLQSLQPIFQEALDNPSLTITRSSSALNTPNWDSLTYIEIIEMIELRFKIKFALGELHDLNDVGELVDLIVEKTAQQ